MLINAKILESLIKKVGNLVIEQGLLVVLLFLTSGYLVYDKIKRDEKLEDRMILMEAKIDTLQHRNEACLFENRRATDEAAKCAEDVRRLQELLYEKTIRYEKVKLEKSIPNKMYVLNDTI